VHSQSRGIKLLLNFQHMTAKAYAAHVHSPALSSNYEGNLQVLAGGADFVGWGQQPYFTEYDSHGRQVFDGRMAGSNSSYRAFRFGWSAVPWTTPAVATSSRGHSTVVYASWNGATTVASWRVMGGSSPSALHWLGAASKRTFETAITVSRVGYVQVQALDSARRVIKSSATVAVH
jgi:hypothetical protein